MSASYVKSKLKAAREALQAQNYDLPDSDILSIDGTNYNARIFLALSLLNLGKQQDSEGNYLRAIQEHPEQSLAYQGLSKLYDQTQQFDKLASLYNSQIGAALNDNDAQRCGEYVQKMIELRLSHGTKTEIIAALSLVTNDSPCIDLLRQLQDPEPTAPTGSGIHALQLRLQDTLPTLNELVRLTRTLEEEGITTEVNKRRMRLGGPSLTAEETRKSVQRENMGSSRLPYLYGQILEHPSASDELRRTTESDLLGHLLVYLASLPSTQSSLLEAPLSEAQLQEKANDIKKYKKTKSKLAKQVKEMAHGMVLIKVPHTKAWQIELDWQDVSCVDDYDLYTLRNLPEALGPESSFATVVSAYLSLYDKKAKEEDEDSSEPDFDPQSMMQNEELLQSGLNGCPECLCAHLLALTHYSRLEDFSATKEISEAGLALLSTIRHEACLELGQTERWLNIALAHSLVYLQPPEHHMRALRMLDNLLATDPENVACLADRGFVLAAAERWEEALQTLQTCSQLDIDDLELAMTVQSELAACLAGLERYAEAQQSLDKLLDQLKAIETPTAKQIQLKAKANWQLGKCQLALGQEKAAYQAYIAALKSEAAYAPAFTALGNYYLENVSPPDHKKASRCFQKAFEIDSTQEEAARRLAEEFSLTGDWDLVEVIARRAISHISAIKPGQQAQNKAVRYAWAWRAVGVADLKSQKYAAATTVFQHALRGTPTDYATWFRLGVSYRGAGKHVAALKTFGHVIQHDPQNWPALFAAGDVQRSIGLIDAALEKFEKAREISPDSTGLVVAIAETRLSKSRTLLRQGFRHRCVESITSSLEAALSILDKTALHSTAWKIVADCVAVYSRLSSVSDELSAQFQQVSAKLLQIISKTFSSKDVTSIFTNDFNIKDSRHLLLEAYKARLLSERDQSSNAWADLGIAIFQTSLNSPKNIKVLSTRSSIQCLRRALRLDPRNFMWWLALGAVAFEISPKLCQHSFIKAAELNSRSPIPWTNLGLFYLHQNAIDLANKSFLRAQTLDPEWPAAWIGQAYLAASNGDERERRALITHAAFLSSGSVPAIDFEFSKLAVAPEISHSVHPSNASALIAIQRYLATAVRDAPATYLSGLLQERAGNHAEAAETFEKAASMFEEDYEETEGDNAAAQYIAARTAQGRSLLSLEKWTEASAALSSAVELCDESAAENKIQALLLLALACAGEGQVEMAIEQSAEALSAAKTLNLPTLVGKAAVIHARCLWRSGEREEAQNVLLEVTSDSDGSADVGVVSCLAAMAICNRDDDLLDAALAEVEALSQEKRSLLDPEGSVTFLLSTQHILKGDLDSAAVVLQDHLHANPMDAKVRLKLADVCLAQGKLAATVETVQAGIDDSADSLLLHGKALVASGRPIEAVDLFQRAVFISPGHPHMRQSLASVLG